MPSILQKYSLVLLRVSWLVALTFSVALFVHYLDPANSGYCSGRSGCEAVRRSGFSYFFGQTWLNLPLLGVVSFSAVLTASFLRYPERLRAKLLGGLAALGGALALVLVGLQAWIGAFCWLCMVVDVAAVSGAVIGLGWLRAGAGEQQPVLALWAWVSLALLLALSPIAAWQLKPEPPVPEVITQLYEPGKINVVEFADFECPYCRTMYSTFERLNEEYGDRVNFRQLHMPLPGHPHSMDAAAAAVCAEAQGKESEMKRLLFTTPLDEDAPIRHAKALGLDFDAFMKCMGSAATVQRIEADRKLLLDAGFRGLPTTFIGDRRIVGWRVYPVLKEAYEAAAAPPGRRLEVSPPVFWTAIAALAIALVLGGRARANVLAKE